MRLRVDRLCRVWQRPDDSWSWRCGLCTSDALPYTGTAASWSVAFRAADRHIRTSHSTTPSTPRRAADALTSA
jgi:hypothetical protein